VETCRTSDDKDGLDMKTDERAEIIDRALKALAARNCVRQS
jgi:hypothetical protein